MDPHILRIAAAITEDPNVINNIIARWDDKSVLSYATYMKVIALFRRVLGKHGVRLDEKHFRVQPEASGFTVSKIKLVFDPKADPNYKKAVEQIPTPPPGGDPTMGAPGALPPGGPEMPAPPIGAPPPAGMPPMEDKQELVDRLIAADGDESVAATFDDNQSVNIYRAISGEFAKEVRDKLGLEVSHFYSAKPPASDIEQFPIFTVTMPKARTEVPTEPAPAQPMAPEAPESTPLGSQISPTDLPADLAPPVFFSDEEPQTEPMVSTNRPPAAESLQARLKQILG